MLPKASTMLATGLVHDDESLPIRPIDPARARESKSMRHILQGPIVIDHLHADLALALVAFAEHWSTLAEDPPGMSNT